MQNKRDTRNYKGNRTAKVNIFTERFQGPHGLNVACSSGWVISDVYKAEKCLCNATEPSACKCDKMNPPDCHERPAMDNSLFMKANPFLLYTVTRIPKNDVAPYTLFFTCKQEQEVFEYVKSLNEKEKRKDCWVYEEEVEYNKRAKAEFKNISDFSNQYE
jgi:hypothetical protein